MARKFTKSTEQSHSKSTTPRSEDLLTHRIRASANAFTDAMAEARIREAAQSGARELDLSRIGLINVPESLCSLTQLDTIILSHNQLTEVPTSLGKLTQLKCLFIGDNQLIGLPASLGELTQLRSLDVADNQLTSLPPSLGQLMALEHFYLGDNHFATLPELLGDLQNLRHVYAAGNQLEELPESIGRLVHLRCLDLRDNLIETLPESFGQLTELHCLNISNNLLRILPDSIGSLLALKELYLHKNDALRIPPEVLGPTSLEVNEKNPAASPTSIVDYYFRTRRGRRPLNEAKLILVGRGGVGKTCLIKQLLFGTFDEHERETPGIEIQAWQAMLSGGEQVRLHVWDFGGQEILHATHQFFLTERTLYLLVLSGREGKPGQDAEYWLQLIRSFGGDSKVIVALNKSTQHPFDVNRGYLQEKYPAIVDFVKTDCQDGLGVTNLRELILRQTEELEYRSVDFPADWFAIKERLAGMEEDFVTWEDYRTICDHWGEQDAKAQKDLAGYLHILGIALNYSDDLRLRDTHVLKPRWVTEGIYPLLRAGQLSRRQGVLEAADLSKVLDPKRYPPSKHDFLLRLMEKFQLCFRLPGEKERYLVPELLGENQPDIKVLLAGPSLGFRYQYEVLPEGLLPRFIVQTHVYSEENPQWRWRTGVVLDWNGCRAVVRADYRERRVDVHVTGPEARRRELLAVVRAAFEDQHRDLKGLFVEERVPVPGEQGVTISYRDLLKREERGEIEFYPENMDKPVAVQALLNGVESPELRTRRRSNEQVFAQQIEHHHYYPTGVTPEFLGISMENCGRDKIIQNISGSTFTNSPLAIQQLLQRSYNTIQQAANEGVKKKLEELHQQVAQLMIGLEPKKAEEVSENFEALVKEATRPEPRRKWYELSAEGLADAANSVKEMAAPVASAVREIAELLFPGG